MPIPDYNCIMRPLLPLLADGQEWTNRELRSALKNHFEE